MNLGRAICTYASHRSRLSDTIMTKQMRYPRTVTVRLSEETYTSILRLAEKLGVKPRTLIREVLDYVIGSVVNVRKMEDFAMLYLGTNIVIVRLE